VNQVRLVNLLLSVKLTVVSETTVIGEPSVIDEPVVVGEPSIRPTVLNNSLSDFLASMPVTIRSKQVAGYSN